MLLRLFIVNTILCLCGGYLLSFLSVDGTSFSDLARFLNESTTQAPAMNTTICKIVSTNAISSSQFHTFDHREETTKTERIEENKETTTTKKTISKISIFHIFAELHARTTKRSHACAAVASRGAAIKETRMPVLRW
jgi:hypothetical protein